MIIHKLDKISFSELNLLNISNIAFMQENFFIVNKFCSSVGNTIDLMPGRQMVNISIKTDLNARKTRFAYFF